MIDIITILLVLIGTVIGAFGAIFLKKGSKRIAITNINLFYGILLYAVAMILYLIALKREKLSVVYPIVSLSYVWVCLLSIKLLKEKMSLLKWLGIAAIIVGVSLIGIGG